MIYWFFGYPGIGKDYCAKKLSEIGKFPYIHADDFLTEGDRKKLLNKTFTVKDRLLKLERIVSHLRELQKRNRDLVIADSLPDNKSREFVINSFCEDIKLILVVADSNVHRKRIKDRKNHFFSEELLDDYIEKNWQRVEVSHVKFENNNTLDVNNRLRELL